MVLGSWRYSSPSCENLYLLKPTKEVLVQLLWLLRSGPMTCIRNVGSAKVFWYECFHVLCLLGRQDGISTYGDHQRRVMNDSSREWRFVVVVVVVGIVAIPMVMIFVVVVVGAAELQFISIVEQTIAIEIQSVLESRGTELLHVVVQLALGEDATA
eukprot:GEZU01017917.1.p1 GENE.GEZU01017917.1~~GEZU01017917.1.p1  ORF type:complete len:156 (-),score=12.13 GEZU01017917.1:416-883(-)